MSLRSTPAWNLPHRDVFGAAMQARGLVSLSDGVGGRERHRDQRLPTFCLLRIVLVFVFLSFI